MQDERISNYEKAEDAGGVRKKSPLQPLLYAAILIAGIFIGTNLGDRNILKVRTGNEQNPNKLVSLIDFIEDNYVDSVDKKKLIDDAITSVLENLDPHSYYISPEELAQSREQIEGKFEGIGVEFMILRDSLMVVRVLPDGPSQKAGLKPGDRITKVENVNICGKELNSEKAQKLLKGTRNSEVRITVVRPSDHSEKEITIVRGSIPLHSVPASFMVNDSLGYIKIERFSQNTYDEFRDAIAALHEKGCTSLVLDLRGNGGGLMDQAVRIIEEFLPEDHLIVYTEGVHQGKEIVKSSKKGEYVDMDLFVMIDQGSASASEIVAGALQDWDRSVTIGRRSFGKGLVQHEIELPDKSAMRLTVARYYTPTGRCIQKPYGDSVDYADDLHKRLIHGELLNGDSIHNADSLKYTTLGALKRTVFGGGGITPDVFVPLDSVYFNGLIGQLNRLGTIREYSFDYIDNHRKELMRYKSAADFIEDFNVTDAMIAEVMKYAGKSFSGANPKQVKRAAPEIKTRIKAQIAHYLFGEDAMYEVLLTNDRDFKKATEIASGGKKYAESEK